MDFSFGSASPIETMKGTEKSSTFFVIAKNKGIKLGIRVFIELYPVEKSIWVSLAYRLRVQADDFGVNSELAVERFGAFPFYESQGHSSSVGVVPLVALPCSPSEVYSHYTSFNGQLEEGLVKMLVEKFTAAGATVTMDPAAIVIALQEAIADKLPACTPTVNTTPDFLLVPLEGKKKPDAE